LEKGGTSLPDPESAAGDMQGPPKERSAMHAQLRVTAGRAGLDWIGIELNWIDGSIKLYLVHPHFRGLPRRACPGIDPARAA
jgi:hypothetical protein